MPQLQYDPGLISMSFGKILIVGIAKGTFVTAERSKDAFMVDVGAGGEATRIRNRDQSGEVTVKLQQSSPTNDQLAARAALDEATGAGAAPFFLKDLNGSTLVHADVAWIKKVAKVEEGDELSDREWVIATGKLEIVPGGNAPIVVSP